MNKERQAIVRKASEVNERIISAENEFVGFVCNLSGITLNINQNSFNKIITKVLFPYVKVNQDRLHIFFEATSLFW